MTIEEPSARRDSAAQARLESWKEIAAYLGRSVRTVRRWEGQEDLPVHRHVHDRQASVYAYRAELDNWRQRRLPRATAAPPPGNFWRPRLLGWIAAVLLLVFLGVAAAKISAGKWRVELRLGEVRNDGRQSLLTTHQSPVTSHWPPV